MSDSSKAPKRSAEEIEADLAHTRAELTDTVNILSERLSPKTQIENAKQTAKAAAGDLTRRRWRSRTPRPARPPSSPRPRP